MMQQENKSSQQNVQLRTKTHPWDGDVEDTRSRMVWFSLLITAIVIILFQTSSAQQRIIFIPEPPDVETSTTEPSNKLSASERRAAEDYQEIMEKLSFIIRNHIEYFSNFDEFEGRKYQNFLLKTLINLEKGNYCGDVNRLNYDLTELRSSLKVEENSLEREKGLRKLYKNVRSLRSDLDMVQEILEEEIVGQLDAHEASISEIKIYLKEAHEYEKQKDEYRIAMFEMQEQLQNEVNKFMIMKDSLEIQFDKSKMKEFLEAAELQEELSELIELFVTMHISGDSMDMIDIDISLMEPLPKSSPIPPIPPLVTYPSEVKIVTTHETRTTTHSQWDDILLSHHYEDSILVRSSKVPIYVTNKIGDLEIEGWSKNKIYAEYYYEVTSDTKEDAKEFLESITLDLQTDRSGIHISTDFPSLHYTKRQVVHSSMILYVPYRNMIDITNSYGSTAVTNIKNDIMLRTKNSDNTIQNIDGNVTAESKQGSCYFVDINGFVQIASDRGAVTLEELNSNINVSNSHAPIYLSECIGDVTLTNSADITVVDHSGNVDIQNNNGLTTVESLDGDLTMTGSYKPFVVSDVNGSVNIQNKNGPIILSDITGKSVVINESGLIKAHSISGYVDFTNNSGKTYFIVNDELDGNSIIRSDYGVINIVLPQESNLLLNASTDGGSILNSYKTKIKKNNFNTSTSIGLGAQKFILEVTGTNATIVIQDSK